MTYPVAISFGLQSKLVSPISYIKDHKRYLDYGYNRQVITFHLNFSVFQFSNYIGADECRSEI